MKPRPWDYEEEKAVCPKCGASEEFTIDAVVSSRVRVDATFDVIDSDEGDTEWEDDSQAECEECGWIGTVSALTDPNATPKVTPADSMKTVLEHWLAAFSKNGEYNVRTADYTVPELLKQSKAALKGY